MRKPMRSFQKRNLPENPMEWSKCPMCKEPFAESHLGPGPGQKTYIHSNGTRHIANEPSTDTTRQTSINKVAALDDLYGRITQVAKAMGATASRSVSSLSIPSAMTATSRTEDAPTLHVNTPNGFQVDFSPSNPLSIGNALSVKATRTLRGSRKSDQVISFLQNAWRLSDGPLSDDDIRACLTPEGPPPV